MIERVHSITGELLKKVFVFDLVKQLQGLFQDAEMSKLIQMFTAAAEAYDPATKDTMDDIIHSESYRRRVASYMIIGL